MNAISRVEGQRGIEEERVEPDTAEGDDPEAVISFISEVCARTATFGEEATSVERGGATGGFPSLAEPLSDRD